MDSWPELASHLRGQAEGFDALRCAPLLIAQGG